MKVLLHTAAFLLQARSTYSQGGGGGGGGNGLTTCSGMVTRFPAPSEGSCLPWSRQQMQEKIYPNDFSGILNKVEIYQCPSSGKRVIISNGVPDHDLTLQNPLAPCEVNWAVEVCDKVFSFISRIFLLILSSLKQLFCRFP